MRCLSFVVVDMYMVGLTCMVFGFADSRKWNVEQDVGGDGGAREDVRAEWEAARVLRGREAEHRGDIQQHLPADGADRGRFIHVGGFSFGQREGNEWDLGGGVGIWECCSMRIVRCGGSWDVWCWVWVRQRGVDLG